jgi:hypothetical protein
MVFRIGYSLKGLWIEVNAMQSYNFWLKKLQKVRNGPKGLESLLSTSNTFGNSHVPRGKLPCSF